MPTILIPAYGRKYATQQEAVTDWDAEKDFKIERGPYCSKRDRDAMARDGHGGVSIRWAPNAYVPV